MAATGTPTPNIGLRIPQGTDPASVDDINYNSTLLDTKLGAVGNESVQDQIDALNSKLIPSVVAVTAATGVTIVDRFVYQMGKLVVVNVSVTIGDSSLSSTASIVQGFPAPPSAVPVVGSKNLGAGNSQAMLTTAGTLANNWDEFVAGKKYFFNFAYMTA